MGKTTSYAIVKLGVVLSFHTRSQSLVLIDVSFIGWAHLALGYHNKVVQFNGFKFDERPSVESHTDLLGEAAWFDFILFCFAMASFRALPP